MHHVRSQANIQHDAAVQACPAWNREQSPYPSPLISLAPPGLLPCRLHHAKEETTSSKQPQPLQPLLLPSTSQICAQNPVKHPTLKKDPSPANKETLCCASAPGHSLHQGLAGRDPCPEPPAHAPERLLTAAAAASNPTTRPQHRASCRQHASPQLQHHVAV